MAKSKEEIKDMLDGVINTKPKKSVSIRKVDGKFLCELTISHPTVGDKSGKWEEGTKIFDGVDTLSSFITEFFDEEIK